MNLEQRADKSVHTYVLPLFTLQFGETLPENLRLWGNLIKFSLNRCLCLLHLLTQAAGGTGKWGRALRKTCQRKTCSLARSLSLCESYEVVTKAEDL